MARRRDPEVSPGFRMSELVRLAKRRTRDPVRQRSMVEAYLAGRSRVMPRRNVPTGVRVGSTVRTPQGTTGRVVEIQGKSRYLMEIPGMGRKWIHGRVYSVSAARRSSSGSGGSGLVVAGVVALVGWFVWRQMGTQA